MNIKDLFNDWVEPDIAQYYLACLLGLMEYDNSFVNFRRLKSIFNVRNKIGDMFFEILEKMVEGGILESNEFTQYRWNQSFSENWENKS